jgi:superfamily II DNA or RNA helicase
MKTNKERLPFVSVTYSRNGSSNSSNELGMRPMQERAYEKRGEQYLLIKSPPASGKSRALMFIALDKLKNQGIKKTIIVVPEKSIGSSFANESLTKFGFWADWEIEPHWNLCNSPGTEGGKIKSVLSFLNGDGKIIVCTHSTFRHTVDKIGIEQFDDCLIAVDEFHHASSNPDNKLGCHMTELILRNKVHILAMTGSYFRGDAVPVLSTEEEAKFETVTYTYYEQLNGYNYLKNLDIGYYFYSGNYSDEILSVLNPKEKTIVHIPSPNSRESGKNDKYKQVEHIMQELGDWKGTEPKTGFQLIKCKGDGRTLRIADLVSDGPEREKVATALKDVSQKDNKDYVDIIIALGMAKEGFDWIWCEHALTVGYRSSLTEIVQIIGRATRDAPGKAKAKFTNLIAEPNATDQEVAEAVNDTLKAISASLLMEQVLAPRFVFKAKNNENKPSDEFDYGEEGYQRNRSNIGYNERSGQLEIEIKGLKEPRSKEAKRICKEDLNEVITSFIQDEQSIEHGMFNEELVAEELTQLQFGRIIKEKYPHLEEDDQEAVRTHAVAALNLTQSAKKINLTTSSNSEENDKGSALIEGIRKYALDVKTLDIDLIDSINPFSESYSILSKTLTEDRLKEIQRLISSKKIKLSPEEARMLTRRAVKFLDERGRAPSLDSSDAWERRMAEGVDYLARMKRESLNE